MFPETIFVLGVFFYDSEEVIGQPVARDFRLDNYHVPISVTIINQISEQRDWGDGSHFINEMACGNLLPVVICNGNQCVILSAVLLIMTGKCIDAKSALPIAHYEVKNALQNDRLVGRYYKIVAAKISGL